jgi:hypothetical protein
VYTESVDRGPLDAGDCPRCAGQLRATYRDGIVEGVFDLLPRLNSRCRTSERIRSIADRED